MSNIIRIPSVLKGRLLCLCIELLVQLVLGLEGPVVGKKEEPGTEEYTPFLLDSCRLIRLALGNETVRQLLEPAGFLPPQAVNDLVVVPLDDVESVLWVVKNYGKSSSLIANNKMTK